MEICSICGKSLDTWNKAYLVGRNVCVGCYGKRCMYCGDMSQDNEGPFGYMKSWWVCKKHLKQKVRDEKIIKWVIGIILMTGLLAWGILSFLAR